MNCLVAETRAIALRSLEVMTLLDGAENLAPAAEAFSLFDQWHKSRTRSGNFG